MPSARPEIVAKFADFPNHDDGIDKAIAAIRLEESDVVKDTIIVTRGKHTQLFWDAVEFLRDEWDYAVRFQEWWLTQYLAVLLFLLAVSLLLFGVIYFSTIRMAQ